MLQAYYTKNEQYVQILLIGNMCQYSSIRKVYVTLLIDLAKKARLAPFT